MKLQRLSITCGGTGGHFYPGLSIAREFRRRGGEVQLLLSGKNIETQALEAQKYDIPVVKLPVMPSPSWRNPLSFRRFWRGALGGRRAARQAMAEFRPQALLGMGSFASLPAVWAAHRMRIPLFLHDGNARIGKANRLFSRWARVIGMAFPPVNAEKIQCPWDVTGMPLRPELTAQSHTKPEAIAALNARFGCALEPERWTILIFGGSQGARSVNLAFSRVLVEFGSKRRDFQVIHLTGKLELELMQSIWGKVDFPVLLLPSLDDMALAYSAADLVVSRSGGSSVAELALFRKFAILVPYPFAAEDHQADNAEYLAAGEAALVVPNNQCEARAGGILQKFFDDPVEFTALGAKSLRLARPNAAGDMIELMGKNLGAVKK